MTTYYLDSSVAVRILLGHSPAAAAWFDEITEDDTAEVISSRLLRTELTRVLRRENLAVNLRGELLDHMGTVPIDHAVLNEAEAIVPHIKTLDAVHLASILRIGVEDIVVVTHDARMRDVAAELGFAVEDPVTDDS